MRLHAEAPRHSEALFGERPGLVHPAFEPELDRKVVAHARDVRGRVDRPRDLQALEHVVDSRTVAEAAVGAARVEERFRPDVVGAELLGHRERFPTEPEGLLEPAREIRGAGATCPHPRLRPRGGPVGDERGRTPQLFVELVLPSDEITTQRHEDACLGGELDVPGLLEGGSRLEELVSATAGHRGLRRAELEEQPRAQRRALLDELDGGPRVRRGAGVVAERRGPLGSSAQRSRCTPADGSRHEGSIAGELETAT